MKKTSLLGLVVAAAATGCAAGGPTQESETAEIYRIHEAVIPTSYDEVRAMSFDLDGNGRRDNAAGATLMSLFANFSDAAATLPKNINAALTDGGVTWYVAVDREAGTVSLFGDEMVGDAAPGTVFADMLGDWPVTWIPANGTVGELAVGADGMLTGNVGFAMPAEFASTLVAPMAQYFTQRLQDGDLLMTAAMDVNHDDVISPDEFLGWELVRALLEPDVDLVGNDGIADSWSIGFGVRAFPVTEVDGTVADSGDVD
jgi:hypothetical protein